MDEGEDVSTHSRPKAAAIGTFDVKNPVLFQHTAARRRLVVKIFSHVTTGSFNTQPPEGGCLRQCSCYYLDKVSTHSRPKAAVRKKAQKDYRGRFNTQPPEGGCCGFCRLRFIGVVSTHSRPKAADFAAAMMIFKTVVQHTAARRRLTAFRIDYPYLFSFNTQPPEGGCPASDIPSGRNRVSTHSRPKAAGVFSFQFGKFMGFNTQPPEGG